MKYKNKLFSIVAAVIALISLHAPQAIAQPMAIGQNGFVTEDIFTVGESINGYFPPGILDGLGAYELDEDTVRILANHELLHFRGYDYEVNDGNGVSITLSGARISYFDIDKESRQIVDAGPAYNKIFDADGDQATDTSFLNQFFAPSLCGGEGEDPCVASTPGGFSRFCSSGVFEAEQFGDDEGLEDRIYFTGEEDGGAFNSDGGAEWALDPSTMSLYHVPAMGRGAWENITEVCTGDEDTVAFILADDSSPFDFDGDEIPEAAPLYLYIGEKDPDGDFLGRNGLRGGDLYVWVANNSGIRTPLDFNGSSGAKVQNGKWVQIDNSPGANPGGIADGCNAVENEKFDDFGYPSQCNLWLQAKAAGAFGFSRPEDVATNPDRCNQVVLASTGVDTYAVDPVTGDGADTFGTMYTIRTNFKKLKAKVKIIYDGDADPTRALRSPDNLDWADDGFIYIQEDEAEEDSLSGEVLFGDGAANPNEAGIVRMNKKGKKIKRVANIDRSVILDPTTAGTPVDMDAGAAGEWESSGILDVSELFDEDAGTLFLFDVQAHGIEDQEDVNPDSRIEDGDLVEGGQLLFLINEDDD